MNLSCEEVDSLAAAWALDAVSEAEISAINEHLRDCTRGHPLLAEYSEAAALLALSVGEVLAPEGLGDRILALADPRHDESAQAVQSLQAGGTQRVRRFPSPVGWWAVTVGIAALLAGIAIGLSSWGIQQHAQLASQRAAATAQAAPMAAALAALSAGGSVVRTPAASTYAPIVLIQPRDDTAAYALVTWSPAPAGKSYQAWFIEGGAPQSAGVFSGTTSGLQVLRLDGPLTGVQTFAVTLEPAGGSQQPTSQPFLVTGLPA